MTRSLLKCAIGAILMLWIAFPAVARSNPEDLLVDITACFNTFVAEIKDPSRMWWKKRKVA